MRIQNKFNKKDKTIKMGSVKVCNKKKSNSLKNKKSLKIKTEKNFIMKILQSFEYQDKKRFSDFNTRFRNQIGKLLDNTKYSFLNHGQVPCELNKWKVPKENQITKEVDFKSPMKNGVSILREIFHQRYMENSKNPMGNGWKKFDKHFYGNRIHWKNNKYFENKQHVTTKAYFPVSHEFVLLMLESLERHTKGYFGVLIEDEDVMFSNSGKVFCGKVVFTNERDRKRFEKIWNKENLVKKVLSLK